MMRTGSLVCLVALTGAVLPGCGGPIEVVEGGPPGPTDVTFFVAADTHFGREGIDRLNKRQIDAMNSLPGTPYPPAVGGRVARPKGVLTAGDLTERGHLSQWRQFVAHYGLTGKDGLLKYPVYEGTGNHDRDVPLIQPVISGVRKRHGGLTYSWDWGDVHLVNLDMYPSAANLRWLRRDLAKVGREAPVIIYFHYSILGPFSDWWSHREKQAFRRAIAGHNVIGIFHGHYHHSGHYTWAGYDVYNVGSPRHGSHSFAVVPIIDGRMTVASWGWDPPVPAAPFRRPVAGWQWHHVKRIGKGPMRSPASAGRQKPALTGAT
ncbi:MAG: hypothetical protein ACYS5V_02640, partial [Planctomycetota bacterium]